MKRNLFYFLVVVFLCFGNKGNAQTQMKAWVLTPNRVNFTTTSSSMQSLPIRDNSHYVSSNGVFEKNGNVLFYVADNKLYDRNSSYIGNYAPGTGTNFGEEVAIVPVPYSCRDFFVIYSWATGSGNVNLYYSQIRISTGGTVSIITSGNLIDSRPGNLAGIAVSKVNTGNIRYLYFKGNGLLQKYTITASGIGFPYNILTDVNLGSDTRELELNFAGNKLAWADYVGNTIHVYDLIGNTHQTYSTSNTDLVKRISGIEFSPDNSKLYVSLYSSNSMLLPGGGIYKIAIPSGTSTFLTGSFPLCVSHLELGRDGYIYGVGLNRQLGRINTSTETVAVGIFGDTINSDVTTTGKCFRLPDQVDGEDYNDFFGLGGCRMGSIDDDLQINSTSISPNPTTDKFMLSFTLDETMPVTIKLIDWTGKEFIVMENEILVSGEHSKEINLIDLPSGIYTYQLSTDKLNIGKVIKTE